jgi:DNA adenine methylase
MLDRAPGAIESSDLAHLHASGDAVGLPDTRVGGRPFLKWAGGKTRLLPRILEHVPKEIVNYHEPFLGGGAVFFALRNRLRGDAYLSDLNGELINAWRAVQSNPEALVKALDEYTLLDSKEFYYQIRSQQLTERISRAARFMYLNQTSWNGLWRVNKWGEYNVPWGARSFRGVGRQSLLQIRDFLANAHVSAQDFRASLDLPSAGDFVYLDPPYLPLSDTSKFCFYTEQRFTRADLEELASMCHELTSRGVAWVLSNRDTALVRQLFSPAEIIPLVARRSVAAQNRRDIQPKHSPEVIVVGRT